MRVIAGSRRGATLIAPRGRETRPTSDRVREALFSILATVEGDRVLDLFAGSGALAIEALSRGAAAATLVDSAPTAIAAIRRNLETLGLSAEVRRAGRDGVPPARTNGRASIRSGLRRSPISPGEAGSVLSLTGALAPVLAPDARVVAESDRRAPLNLELPLLDERRYGDTLIRIHGPR